MKRMYISTVFRYGDNDPQPNGDIGHVYIYDWEQKKLLVDPRGIEPDYSLYTPQGRSHGCRGLTVHDGELYVASSGKNICIFNLDTYKQDRELSFDELQATHQIKSHQGKLHVVSTKNNTIVRIQNDKICEVTTLENIAPIVDPYINETSRDRPWTDDRLHFNSIGWAPNGDEYHTYYAANMVFNFTQKKIAYQGGVLHCPHDVLPTSDGFYCSSSMDKSVFFFRNDGVIFTMLKNKEHSNPKYFNDGGFTRGIALGDDMTFICSAPTKISSFKKGVPAVFLEEVNIANDPHETIYDIALDPRDWS